MTNYSEKHIIEYANQPGTILSSCDNNSNCYIEFVNGNRIYARLTELKGIALSEKLLEAIGFSTENGTIFHDKEKTFHIENAGDYWLIENQPINYLHELQNHYSKLGNIPNDKLLKLVNNIQMLTYNSLKGALYVKTNNTDKDKMLKYSTLKGALAINTNK